MRPLRGPVARVAGLGRIEPAVSIGARCPRAGGTAARRHMPRKVAGQALARMTLDEKLGPVDLHAGDGYEKTRAVVEVRAGNDLPS